MVVGEMASDCVSTETCADLLTVGTGDPSVSEAARPLGAVATSGGSDCEHGWNGEQRSDLGDGVREEEAAAEDRAR